MKLSALFWPSLALTSALLGCADPDAPPLRDYSDLFESQRLAAIYNVDDAGVGDLDGDGRLDLWTTNHSARQWIALGSDGKLDGAAGADRLGLHQVAGVPGMEATLHVEPCDTAASRVFFERDELIFQGGATGLAGRMYMPWPSRIVRTKSTHWRPLDCPQDLDCTHAEFQLQARAELRLRTIPERSDGFPIRIEFAPQTTLSTVRLGSACVPPASHRIELTPKDRHGLLLASLGSNDDTALFISRGGARGRLSVVDPGALDELFIWHDGRYSEQIRNSGIRKDGCPGRQVGAMDIDGDGRLDIYQVCGRAQGSIATSRNRLYLQRAPGRFEEAAEAWGLALEGPGSFAWIPRPGARPTLVWVSAHRVSLLDYSRGTYRERWRADRQGGHEDPLIVGHLDGELAVMILSRAGNALLELGPAPRLIPFPDLGLPTASIAGDLIDLDGDGGRWLFLVPQGLYQRQPDGRWRPDGRLALSDGLDIREARSNWFDADGDGHLDLWLLLKEYRLAPRPLRWPLRVLRPEWARRYIRAVEAITGPYEWQTQIWQSYLLRRRGQTPTHATIQIIGPPGNRQALGTRIIARGGDRTTTLTVGHADGSHLSQTHHRVYVGIAGLERLDSLRADFADGHSVELNDVAVYPAPVLIHLQAREAER